MVAMAPSTSSRAVRSTANVISFDTDFTVSSCSTGASSPPFARTCMTRPFLPNTRSSMPSSASASCPSVRMPRECSFSSAAAPMPLIVRTGRGARKSRSPPGYTTVSPRGLSMSEAIFAMVFDVPTPMEHVTPSSSTRLWMRWATRTGCSRFTDVGDTSMNASSMLTCCTCGVSARRISMMAFDISR